jgi:hypothetical protein
MPVFMAAASEEASMGAAGFTAAGVATADRAAGMIPE